MAAGGGGRGEQRTGQALLPFHAPRAICVRQHGNATVTHLCATRQRKRKEENDREKKREKGCKGCALSSCCERPETE